MASLKAVLDHKIVDLVALTGAQRPLLKSHACSSARSVVPSVCVCLQGPMGTNKCALATTAGRPREGDPNVHELQFQISRFSLVFMHELYIYVNLH
ncbi:hypothetical protein Sjap_002229 [Stephania japonica]|uniref:Uncharacterized protein n=1 Tax=Stephania japonica TaxID=461633 RepID=A0AAP0PUC6_9MAGN